MREQWGETSCSALPLRPRIIRLSADPVQRVGSTRQSPNWIRKVSVIAPAWNHMPVQVGHLVTQTCKIDFIG
jgi:hypothetical protein